MYDWLVSLTVFIWAAMKSKGIQSTFILLGAIVAAIAVKSARTMDRRKSTVDALFNNRRDEEMTTAIRQIAKIHHDPDIDLKKFANKSEVDTNDAIAIRYFLNHWEYMSIGIQEKIYDERMLKKASCGTVVSLYDMTRDFITQSRQIAERPTMYQEYEYLAKRWSQNKLRVRSSSALKRLWRRLICST